jgi:hypothetical protein
MLELDGEEIVDAVIDIGYHRSRGTRTYPIPTGSITWGA